MTMTHCQETALEETFAWTRLASIPFLDIIITLSSPGVWKRIEHLKIVLTLEGLS